MDHDLTLKDAALQLGFIIDEATFARVVNLAKKVKPYVAAATRADERECFLLRVWYCLFQPPALFASSFQLIVLIVPSDDG
jgi:hypothetical protein